MLEGDLKPITDLCLCKKCGMCCRVATSAIPHSELLELAENGDTRATDFLSIFEPYESIEDAKKVSAEVVENVINHSTISDITFYKCKYINDENLCTNYENRPLLCRVFPQTPWAVVPPKCGYNWFLFEKQEEIKQKIRAHKEELLELELLYKKTKDDNTKEKISAVMNKLNDNINLYEKYGSKDW